MSFISESPLILILLDFVYFGTLFIIYFDALVVSFLASTYWKNVSLLVHNTI